MCRMADRGMRIGMDEIKWNERIEMEMDKSECD